MSEIKNMFREHQDDDRKNFGEIKDSIQELTVEVRKTNGSVRKLQLWRSYLMGGMTIISAMVLPLLLFIVSQYIL